MTDRKNLVKPSRMQKIYPKSDESLDFIIKYNKLNINNNNNGEKPAVDNSKAESPNVICYNKYFLLKSEYDRSISYAMSAYDDPEAAKQSADKKFTAEELKIIAAGPPRVPKKTKKVNNPTKKPQPIASVLQLLHQDNLAKLLPDVLDKSKRFAWAIKSRKIATGYAANLSIKDLTAEIIHHTANWQPNKINCANERERQDAALAVAWRHIANGKWRCPQGYNKIVILEREHQAYRNKINQYGYEPKEWAEHCREINKVILSFNINQGKENTL
jgi:hypothetical protein